MTKVSLLIPAYNEEKVLVLLYQRIKAIIDSLSQYDWEILFINDGSKDNTLAVLNSLRNQDERINILDLSRNYGKEVAMLAGFDYVRGDGVIILDADLQDPPELIPQMLNFWEQGYDDVYAKRNSRKGETFFKKKTSQWFYKILQKSTKIPIQLNTGDFRLLDRKCVEALKQIRESNRYTKGMFSWIGYNKKEILFDRDPRAAGETKWNYLKLFSLAIEGITSFTTRPLRISTVFGGIISFFSFLYAIYMLYDTFIYGNDVKGYPSLLVIILFLGGIQLLSLGIMGEYIARIFIETKNRPTYFARSYNGDKII
ncbi:MAG: glycosyltransferase family 2 protein [Bacteroidales bacterium]|nr:glycosyltransferase family 2 protein [Bacteroidales bacterium]MDD4528333.1 glycosyltransferase family 2 protein [Bacteroidales bacterium]MDD4829223.1 glycosyltransferase family 2 protein [Bacteroidales bacterium]